MKQIICIYAEHADAPRISCNLDLNAWEVDKFDDLDKLVKHLTDELKAIWMYSNGQSVAASTMPRKEMIKYFWSKRPTKIAITFKDDIKSVYAIDYPKDAKTFPNISHGKPEGWNKNSNKKVRTSVDRCRLGFNFHTEVK